ncbi:hypothetical protein [Rhodobacter sp. TJ_12]|uniref:hypothetical protein n=1 Tax=Rhodobacter sp. TJ_12 TaxID=2029399 RepID=UPI001CC1247E|nr:hypothetical protein [Rhodobacter sp. TJ_12]
MRRAPALFLLMLAPNFAWAEPMQVDLKSTVLSNPTAYIPPQCYTKTEDAAGGVHNPCFTCHVSSRAPHYINDADLQTAYSFPEPALENPWTNLFVDRRAAVARVSDTEILAYIRQGNYLDAAGTNLLAERLEHLPPDWDVDGNGTWDGFTPDVAYNFDAEGFDIGADGQMTGWRAFAYYPLNGAFWPTNGATDDVMIRLPDAYRQTEDGRESRSVYKVNLAITEALIRRAPVPIEPTDERPLGVDLDKDGTLGQALNIAFDWAPKEGRNMSYVGRARVLQAAGEAPLAAGLYPLGTEFLHTVRYIDVDEVTGQIRMAARLKELRYMRKTRWQTYFDRQEGALAEAKERDSFPDRIALFFGSSEVGVSNGTGWRLQGFIEDATGDLRPQSFEETVFCIGCHGGVGANDDDTFAFPRKLAGTLGHGGWWHWSQRGLYDIPEMIRADGAPEYAHYLAENGAGDELRGNMEVIDRYLTETGDLRPDPVAAFRADVSQLLYPSRKRALALNKAYREIVREQSFVKGRDATLTEQENVHRSVTPDQPTAITRPLTAWYD